MIGLPQARSSRGLVSLRLKRGRTRGSLVFLVWVLVVVFASILMRNVNGCCELSIFLITSRIVFTEIRPGQSVIVVG